MNMTSFNLFDVGCSVIPTSEVRVHDNRYKYKRKLGEGGFAFVYLMEDLNSGKEVVLKRINLQGEAQCNAAVTEVQVMKALNSENVVKLFTECTADLPEGRVSFIIMEYCTGGHLLNQITEMGSQRFAEKDLLHIFQCICNGVKSMHDYEPCITHRDLKLENILLSTDGCWKICDFGSAVFGEVDLSSSLARSEAEEVIQRTTTQCYRAPEMVDLYMKKELTFKTDLWALGCILYALSYFRQPFQDEGNLAILSARYKMPVDRKYSSSVKHLIGQLLTVDADRRPDIYDVLECIQMIREGRPIPEAHYESVEVYDATKSCLLLKNKMKPKVSRSRARLGDGEKKKLDPGGVAARRLQSRQPRSRATSSDTKRVSELLSKEDGGETIERPHENSTPSRSMLEDFADWSAFSDESKTRQGEEQDGKQDGYASTETLLDLPDTRTSSASSNMMMVDDLRSHLTPRQAHLRQEIITHHSYPGVSNAPYSFYPMDFTAQKWPTSSSTGHISAYSFDGDIRGRDTLSSSLPGSQEISRTQGASSTFGQVAGSPPIVRRDTGSNMTRFNTAPSESSFISWNDIQQEKSYNP